MTRLASFYFAYFLALGAFSPYFSPFLEARGLDPGQISVMMSLWYGTRLFAPPLWTWGAARIGPPMLWLRAGCAITLSSFALFLLPLPYAGLIVVMLVFASFYNAVMPQFEAITLEQLGARRDRYGQVRLWGSVGFLLANLGFGQLLEHYGYGSLIGWMLPCFGLLCMTAWLNREPTGTQAMSAPPDHATSTPKAVRGWLLVAFLMQVTHGPLYVYLSLFLAEHGWTAPMIGLAWAVGVIAEVFMFLWMPQVLRHIDARWVVAACLLVGALRWWLLSQFPDSTLLVLGTQMLHALTFAAFHASIMSLVSTGVSGAALAQVQSRLYSFSSGGGGVAGTLLAGWVWLQLSHAACFAIAAAISLTAFVLVLLSPRLRPEPHHAH